MIAEPQIRPKTSSPFQDILELGGEVKVKGLTRQHFIDLASKYPELQMERESNGNITIMAPVKGGGGIRESRFNRRVGNWCEKHLGGETFSSSGGFDLPNGAIKCPDVAWVSEEKMSQLDMDKAEEEFLPLVPDFVVEIRSKTDRLPPLKNKMQKTWIANGVRLAWLIDPYQEKAHVYRIDGSKEIIEGFDKQLSGEDVLPGFVLELNEFRLLGKRK